MLAAAAASFLNLEEDLTDFGRASIAVLPLPCETGVSFGRGAALGPAAIIAASAHVEFYDQDLDAEPCDTGICTLEPPELAADPAAAREQIAAAVGWLIEQRKLPIILGGDHSVTVGCVQAMAERCGALSVLQLDAHADLRDEYDGTPWSHACVMRRVRDITPDTLQIGIRSLCREEARLIHDDRLPVFYRSDLRLAWQDVVEAIRELPDPVYLTVDVDVFDWSVIAATGTPEPDGLLWSEVIDVLEVLFAAKTVVGMDFVELAPRPDDINSPFAVARLVYKAVGLLQSGSLGAAVFDCGRFELPLDP